MSNPRGKLRGRSLGPLWFSLWGGLPAIAAAVWLLPRSHLPSVLSWLVGSAIVLVWLVVALAAQRKMTRTLQTMANLIAALREGDFSVRARVDHRGEAMGDVLGEINTLSLALQEQRLSALEATALLQSVMQEIEVAIFAFDEDQQLRLVNPAGARLTGQELGAMIGRSARDLGLVSCLSGEPTRVLPLELWGAGHAATRWGMRRSAFRQGGRAHQLLVIADLTRPLRQEELRAWQGLVRVLGHELNNSLTPIKSIAGSLDSLLRRSPRPADWEDDMRSGLEVIESRAESLASFLSAYSELAKLPAPQRAPCELAELISRVVRLENPELVRVTAGEAIRLHCDGPQIEQVLINLVRNAREAVVEANGSGEGAPSITLAWRKGLDSVEITVEDSGPGIANPANLFVPFFTTKAAGSGIGLVLSRQIAENHGGTLGLQNRVGVRGAVATLTLPL